MMASGRWPISIVDRGALKLFELVKKSDLED
jgi:hypothetical protein